MLELVIKFSKIARYSSIYKLIVFLYMSYKQWEIEIKKKHTYTGIRKYKIRKNDVQALDTGNYKTLLREITENPK